MSRSASARVHPLLAKDEDDSIPVPNTSTDMTRGGAPGASSGTPRVGWEKEGMRLGAKLFASQVQDNPSPYESPLVSPRLEASPKAASFAKHPTAPPVRLIAHDVPTAGGKVGRDRWKNGTGSPHAPHPEWGVRTTQSLTNTTVDFDTSTSPRTNKFGTTRKKLQLHGRSQLFRSKSRRTALGRLLRNDSSVSHSVLLRAVFAALLAIVEQPVSSNAYWRHYTRAVHPFIVLIVQFFQLNLFNSYTFPLPPLSLPYKQRFTQGFTRLFYVQLGIGSLALALEGVVVLALGLLVVQFRLQSPSRLVIRLLSAAIWIITGILYMPMLREMSQDAVSLFAANTVEGRLGGVVRIICIIAFLPLCLFVSQNGFEEDERAFHLFRRKHNRLEFLEIAVKALVVFTNGSAVVNLVLFSLLLLCHFLAFPFHDIAVNRVLTGMYASLAYGASCRLYANVRKYGPGEHDAADRAFWIGLPVVFTVAMSITLESQLRMARARLNDYLMRHLYWFDLADNPEIIDGLHLANLLESATRMGKYANFKAEKGSLAQATTIFQKALMKDPEHASNLGNYAVLLLKKGESKEAERFFRKALKVAPDHRENLERFAHFLNQRKDEESLFFYQQSLLCYLEHSAYRDMYANSSDPMLILSPSARIIDCNGAALYMFRAKSRADLVDRKRKATELFSHEAIPADFEDSFSVGMEDEDENSKETDPLNATSADGQAPHSARSSTSSASMMHLTFIEQFHEKFCETLDHSLCTRFPSRVITLEKEQLTVRIILTRIRKGSRYVLHLAIMDVTKLTEVVQTNKMILQTAMTCMVMVDDKGLIRRVNLLTEETFGYCEKELRNRPISRLLPAKVWAAQVNMTMCPSDQSDAFANSSTAASARFSDTSFLGDETFRNSRSFPLPRSESDMRQSGAFARARTGEGAKKMYSVTSQEDEEEESGTGAGWADEVKIRAKDGKELTCSIKINRLENGPSAFYVVCLHDVTELVEALSQNRLVFDSGTMPLLMMDERGIIRRFNKAACSLTGFKHPNEVLGMNVRQLIESEYAQHNETFLRRFLVGRWKDHHLTRDVPILVRTGEVRVCSVTLSELRVNADRYFLGLLTDMTDLKQSLEINNLSFQKATVPMIMTDSSGKIVRWNHQCESTFKYRGDYAIGKDVGLIMVENETPRTPHKRQGAPTMRRRDSMHAAVTIVDHPFLSQFKLGKGVEVPLKTRAGQIRTCFVQVDEFCVGKSRYYILCLTDVTALNEALQTNRLIFEKSMVPTFVIDERARFIRVNDALEALTGLSADELLGTNCKLLLEESAAKHSDMFLRKFLSRAQGRLHEFTRDVPVVTREGEIRECTVKLSEVQTGATRFFVGLLLDITEVQELIKKNKQVFENAPTSMFMLDDRGSIVQLNKRVVEWLGYPEDELRGHSMDKILAKESVAISTHKAVEEQRRGNHVPQGARASSASSDSGRASIDSDHGRRGRGSSRSSILAALDCSFLSHYFLCTLGMGAWGPSPKVAAGHRARWEDRVVTKSGKVKTVVFKVNSIQAGSRTFYLACLQDITKLKEATLSNTEAFDNSPRPLIVVDSKGIIKVFNAGARSLSGYSRADEVVGRNVGVFLLPDLETGETGEQLIHSAASLSSSGGVEGSTVQVRVATRVGHVRTCNMRVLAQQQQQQQPQGKGDNGEEAVYIISLDDVTALQARVEALRGLFDACGQPLLLVTDDGVIQDVNAAVERQWGYLRSDLCGHGVQRVLGGADATRADALRRTTELLHHALLQSHGRQLRRPESFHSAREEAMEEVLVNTVTARLRLCQLRVSVVGDRGGAQGAHSAVDLLLCTFTDVTVLPDILSPARMELEHTERQYADQNHLPYQGTMQLDKLMSAMAGSLRTTGGAISLLSPRSGSAVPSPRPAEPPSLSHFGWGANTIKMAEMWNAPATGTLRLTMSQQQPSIEEEDDDPDAADFSGRDDF